MNKRIAIEIDEEVYKHLQEIAIPFEEDPNAVIKKLLSLYDIDKPISAGTREHRQISSPPGPKAVASKIRSRGRNGTKSKQPKANMKILIDNRMLREGQTVYFHDYSGTRVRGEKFQATVRSNNKLSQKQDGSAYSMSELASLLLFDLGHKRTQVRGPQFWFTQDGLSIRDLWSEYLSAHDG